MGALFIVTIILFLLGIIYPLIGIAVYPIYKKLGGDQTFKEYWSNL